MQVEIDGKIFEEFITYDQIKKRIRLLGIQLSVDFESSNPVFLGVLNGSFMFLGDLVKELSIPCEISFVKLASYQGTERQEEVKQLIGLSDSLNGRDVIIVEDIVDSGHTLKKLIQDLQKNYTTRSISICSLLVKPNALQVEIPEVQYVGFEISNEFVVGYGLDYNNMGRNLSDIYKEIS